MYVASLVDNNDLSSLLRASFSMYDMHVIVTQQKRSQTARMRLLSRQLIPPAWAPMQ
jgi:hypothetical protein